MLSQSQWFFHPLLPPLSPFYKMLISRMRVLIEFVDRVSTGQDVPLSLCPGTKKKFLSRCPFVPGQGQEQMSRDKHLCPGTSRDKITFPKEHKKQEKDIPKQENDQISCFRTSFSWVRTSFFCFLVFLEGDFVPGRPGTEGGCPGPGIFAPALVPGQRDNGTPHPGLSREILWKR